MTRHRRTGRQREELYDREADKARAMGRGEHPICNLCDLPVAPGQEWDESHVGRPAALGGRDVGVAHRRCNRRHGAQVVTPMVAKAKRARQKHIRAALRSRRPLPGARDSNIKIRMNGPPVDRRTGERWRGW